MTGEGEQDSFYNGIGHAEDGGEPGGLKQKMFQRTGSSHNSGDKDISCIRQIFADSCAGTYGSQSDGDISHMAGRTKRSIHCDCKSSGMLFLIISRTEARFSAWTGSSRVP